MTYLEASGASLYYECVGEGPMLLCISGADGSCEIWQAFAQCLKEHFTVVTYDRISSITCCFESYEDANLSSGRGFSRSYLSGAQDYELRLETDTDDAASLINHISANQSVTVIGNSSGAIVSLRLLTRHPSLIRTLISYEPPAARLLPDFEDLWTEHQEVYHTYRRSGAPPALAKFARLTKADQDLLVRMIDPRNGIHLFSNTQYWFEREFLYYPKTDLDVENDLVPHIHKMLLVNGELSPRQAYQYRANAALAERLGLELMHFPGEHVGHATHAEDFSKRMLEVLRERQ